MKLSVFYDHILKAAQQQNKPLPEMLALVRGMGYSMVEADLDALNEEAVFALKEADLEISSIYCFFRFDSEPQKERIRTLVDSAVRFGAKRVMPIPGFFHGETEAARSEELDRMLIGMKELTALAANAGLTVTIEDFGDANSPIRDSRGMNYFLSRLPDLYATLDTGNFRLAGEDEMAAFEALKPRIAHVHLKDRSASAEYGSSALAAADGSIMYPCPVGAGYIPMERIFASLREIGYDGVLSAEHFGAQDQFTCMRKSAEFVQKYFDFA